MSGAALWLSYMAILFFANVMGAVGGFGAGLISIPFLTQLFDAKLVIMASTMTCILNIFIAVKNWKYIDFKKLFTIAVYMCVGLPAGVYGLKVIHITSLKLLLGVFMTMAGGYGLLKLWIPGVNKKHLPAWSLRICLIAGGVVQGAISSGGSLVLLYAQQELEDKRQFRATMALLWTVVSLITTFQYMLIGGMIKEAAGMSALGAPAVLLGIYAGGILCRYLSQRAFMYLINILILGAGMFNCCQMIF